MHQHHRTPNEGEPTAPTTVPTAQGAGRAL